MPLLEVDSGSAWPLQHACRPCRVDAMTSWPDSECSRTLANTRGATLQMHKADDRSITFVYNGIAGAAFTVMNMLEQSLWAVRTFGF